MNNFQKIKAMSIDEMAEFSSVFQRCSFCVLSLKENGQVYCDLEQCRKIACKDGIKQWLESESE